MTYKPFSEFVASSKRVTAALGYAIIKHGDQKYGQEPYLNHLLRVAKTVYDVYLTKFSSNANAYMAPDYAFGESVVESVVSAALLHDVLEDTDATYDDLGAMFGAEVSNVVLACTKDPNDDEDDLCRECSFKRTVSALKKEPHAIAVKLADRLVNMQKATQERSTHLNMYVREYPTFKRLLQKGVDQPENLRLWGALDAAFEEAQLRVK